MKYPKEDAKRWLREAKNTLLQTGKAREDKFYNLACFLAEQTSQKALKAVLYFFGARQITIHSIFELIKKLAEKDSQFSKFADKAKILDRYYIITRYPDAVARPAIPSELFSEKEASEAINIAKKICNFCEKFMDLPKDLGIQF